MACVRSVGPNRFSVLVWTLVLSLLCGIAQAVPLYKPFEQSITNNNGYANKFTDVTLTVQYSSPTNRQFQFYGFYDGDGAGGQSGNMWKIRFMPDEAGTWSYSYTWSDGTPGGSGTFTGDTAGAGPGVLKPYGANPHWFAYNGTQPVFLKSFYLGAGGFVGVPINWAASNVYGKLQARGYNHVQMIMLPIGWTDQKPSDAPADHISRPLWRNTPLVQDIGVWRRMEQHVAWLNDRNIAIHFFMGFDPKPEGTPDQYFALQRWQGMSAADQEFYVRYVASRLAPYANIAGWNYTWETNGGADEIRLMDLLAQYDPWTHVRTYHDSAVRSNSYGDGRFTFAGIENHGYFGNANGNRAVDSASHYQSTIDAYNNKPVYMVEGNGLWRACWAQELADPSITRSAWAVTLAGGSFTWQDSSWQATDACSGFTAPSTEMFTWPAGNPMVDRLDVLYSIMAQDVVFHRMNPRNDLLSNCPSSFNRDGGVPFGPCYALAETGSQYLAYKEEGGSFGLNLASGTYTTTWIDTRTGARQPANGGTVSGGGIVSLTTPDVSTDWVLLAKVQTPGGQQPYPGPNPSAIPGTIQAENFDTGGEGIAYHDLDVNNNGGAYRSEAVDIQASGGAESGGYDVGWTRAGEWLEYTVNVATGGYYTVEARVASDGDGGSFHIEFDGVDRTGTFSVPNTGGWQSWSTLTKTGVFLNAGSQVMRIVQDSNGSTTGSIGNINWLRFVQEMGGTQTPYPGPTPAAIPGTIQAENFDNGGEAIAYHDIDAANNGGAYRNTGVDIQVSGGAESGGYDVGWTRAGEWLEYTVNVVSAGTYTVEARVASDGVGGTFHIEFNGADRTGPITVPNTGGWQSWVTLTVTGVALQVGTQVMRIVHDANGLATNSVANINWVRFTAPSLPTLSGTIATPPAAVDLSTEGSADWAHWGLSDVNSYNHRGGIGPQISNYTVLGSNAVGWYGDNLVTFSWNNGTPTANVGATTTGIYNQGLNNGFQVTVPADLTTRTVKLYVGAWGATGRLEASLSDNSAPAYADSSLTGGTNDGGSVAVYTITYRAGSANQQLTLRWTVGGGNNWGNVQLQAATLVQN